MKDSQSTGKVKKWHFPRITELNYPTRIKSLEDWDDWVNGALLDRRLSDQTARVLMRLAQFRNLITGRCDPANHHLGTMAGLDKLGQED